MVPLGPPIRGGPPGGAPDPKKCTFFWVFNNSPIRDRKIPPRDTPRKTPPGTEPPWPGGTPPWLPPGYGGYGLGVDALRATRAATRVATYGRVITLPSATSLAHSELRASSAHADDAKHELAHRRPSEARTTSNPPRVGSVAIEGQRRRRRCSIEQPDSSGVGEE